jgi:hypothetical protein
MTLFLNSFLYYFIIIYFSCRKRKQKHGLVGAAPKTENKFGEPQSASQVPKNLVWRNLPQVVSLFFVYDTNSAYSTHKEIQKFNNRYLCTSVLLYICPLSIYFLGFVVPNGQLP